MNATDREYEAGDRQCTEIAQLIGDLERQSQMEGGVTAICSRFPFIAAILDNENSRN